MTHPFTLTTLERRVKPGLMASLVFGRPAGQDTAGWYAEVEMADGRSFQLSRMDGEAAWAIDAHFTGSFPIFVNGFGARYLRLTPATPQLAAFLDEEVATVEMLCPTCGDDAEWCSR